MSIVRPPAITDSRTLLHDELTTPRRAGTPRDVVLRRSPAGYGAGNVDLGLSGLYRHSPAERPRLRVGVLLDGMSTIRCFRHALDDLRASDFVDLALVVVNASSEIATAGRTPRWRRYWNAIANPRSRAQLAYTLYTRFVDALPAHATDPLELVDCSDLLAGVPVLPVTPITSRFVHRFPPDAVDRLRAADLDVLVRFGFNIVRGEVLQVPRFGVWSYHHGDPDSYRGGPALYWEMVEHNPVSGSMLQVLTEELDGGLVLCKGTFATSPTLSLAENRYAPYWGTQHFLIQKLNELHRYGWEFVRSKALPPSPYAGRRTPYRTPNNREFARWIASEVAHRASRRRARRETDTDWNIAVRRSDTPLPVQTTAEAAGSFMLLENPAGRFLADPFLVPRDGTTWLFVEDYAFDARRAVISCGKLTADGDLDELHPCLERPYHLSYPHVFWHEDQAFMVPESEASGLVELYRAKSFPDVWVRECTLLELRAVDPTVFRHAGSWWMFVTHTAVPGQSVMTLLFRADSLFGPWTLHRSSPVNSDVRTSRSAGAVLSVGDRLLRPAQNCSIRYGRALVWNEIMTITPDDYRECTLTELDARAMPGFDGLHHFHRAGDWEVIDVRRQSPLQRFRTAPARDDAGALLATSVRREKPRT